MLIYLQTIDTPEQQSAFEQVYKAYRGLMFCIANNILHNEQDAEDAVHNAFVAIGENIHKIDVPVCPKTKGYVVTIVESKAIDIYRKKQRRQAIALTKKLQAQKRLCWRAKASPGVLPDCPTGIAIFCC